LVHGEVWRKTYKLINVKQYRAEVRGVHYFASKALSEASTPAVLKKLLTSYIKSTKNMDSIDFDVAVATRYSFSEFHFDSKDWKQSTCNCRAFFKDYICNHILAIGVAMDMFKLPNWANNTKIGQKNKPGRKRKAQGCLEHQPNDD
jgi:hypothetical protein